MTNRERYRRTFGALHVSDERLREVYFMEKNRKMTGVGRTLLIAACVMALLTVSAFAANEATGGKVFQKISVAVNYVLAEVIPNSDGSYTIKTEDGNEYQYVVKDVYSDGDSSSVTFELEVDENARSVSVQVEGAAAAEVNP